MNILGWFKGAVQKSSVVGPMLKFIGLGQAVWTPRQYDKLTEASYMRNIIAYRAVGLVAKAVASIPITLLDAEGDEVELHPVLDLLNNPNPQQAWPELCERMVSFFLLSGNAYVELRKEGVAAELYSHRPDRILIVPGRFGFPAEFQYRTGGREPIKFKVDPETGMGEMLHIKTFHPLNDWYGMSPIEAAATSVDMHNEASTWNKRLLQNSGAPSGAFSYKPNQMQAQNLTEPQYQRLQKQIDEKMTGPENAGTPYIMDGGMEWQGMGLSPRDMDWMEGRNMSAREICFAFGVPGMMVGIPGDNTYANMEEARLSFYEETVLPVGGLFLRRLGKWLSETFDLKGMTLEFDLDEVPALYERRKQKWDMVSQANCLTINEQREALGYKKIDEPMADEVLMQGTLTPLADVGAEPPAQLDAEGNPVPPNAGKAPPPGKKAKEGEDNIEVTPLETDRKGRISLVRISRTDSEIVRR